jgi:hypothetical protein
MFLAVLIRRLRDGKSYEDFVRAWYPDEGFGVAGRGPLVARSVTDERELLTFSLVDIDSPADLEQAMTRIARQEAVRHDRIAEVIESTTVSGIYEQLDEFDFATDESVTAGRPPYVER